VLHAIYGLIGDRILGEDEYTPVKVPNDLLSEIDRLVGKHGYKSRQEVVKDAVRRLLATFPKEA